MSRRLIFLSSAELDFIEAYNLIAMDSPRAAFDFIEDIRLRCEPLAEFPRMGRSLDGFVYRITFDRRVTIFYSFDDTAVRVSALRYLGQA